MAIMQEHIVFFREIFRLPGFFSSPFLMIGRQKILGNQLPRDFDYIDFVKLLEAHKLKKVASLDLFDDKADIKHDLNLPIAKKWQNKFKTVIDIGTLEHIFDTRQALENYARLTAAAGLLVLHAPVNGYFGHGLHVFSPQLLIDCLKLNGFKIIYQKYSTETGRKVDDPATRKNILLWLVGKKTKPIKKFIIPQQGEWKRIYSPGSTYTFSWPHDQDFVTSFLLALRKLKHWLFIGLRGK